MSDQVTVPALPPADYEHMTVGDEFGPVELAIDDYMVRTFVYAVDDFNPWYLYDSPFGGRVTPAVSLAREVLSLYTLKYDVGTDRGIHARQELRFFEPVRIGQTVKLQARFVDKFVKRGKPYVITEGEVVDAASGKTLVWFKGHEMVGMTEGLELGAGGASAERADAAPFRVETTADATLPVAERAAMGIPSGSPLPTLAKHVTPKQMFAFSAYERFGAWDNMHTDADYARSIGLPGPIVQGLMTAAYVCEAGAGFFGESWFTSGEIRIAFVRPVYAHADLLVTGAVRSLAEIDGDGARQEIDLWCSDRDGTPVTVARASALVR
jgi:acyl dehydratase